MALGVRMIVGDVRRVLDDIPDGSVDFVWTSPPFFNARSYLPPGHAHKQLEIGSESTPAEYLDTMLTLVEQIDRALAPHGSIGFEIGDQRSGSGGAGGDYNDGGLREGQQRFDGTAAKARQAAAAERGKPDGGSWSNRQLDVALGIRPPSKRWKGALPGYPLDKSLLGIPTLFTWSLAYGRNMLAEPATATEVLYWVDELRARGWSAEQALAYVGGWAAEHQFDFRFARQFDPWRIRNLAVWARRNPPVGAVGDKFRDSCSYITIACKARDRWFDLEAVRHENSRASEFSRNRSQLNRGSPGYHTGDDHGDAAQNPMGAPPLDHWVIAPAQYRGSHYAVMPEELCKIPIESMCPRRVCRSCGEPSRRINNVAPSPWSADARSTERMGVGPTGTHHGSPTRSSVFVGWSSCECPGTGDLWQSGWREVDSEVGATLKETRKRGISKAEAERIRVHKLQPLYDQLAAMYQGRHDGMHDGAAWRSGLVLDPFFGTGTTGAVASSLGRDCIGIDLDERNVSLVDERLGIWLESVETVGS
jgi:hypothetical protein